MKNSGTRKAMQTPTWKSICAMLCLLLLLPALLPVKAAAETTPAKVVRVGSFEDTFNYVNEKGARKGCSTSEYWQTADAKKAVARCFYESIYEILLKIHHGGGKIIL